MSPPVHAPAPTVSVVVPTLNESKNLPHVFARLGPEVNEVILVDGGSVDGTVETARSLRPDVRIIHQSRRGKGNALACGFAAASGEVVVALDADGSADPAEIPAFVATLTSGADFAKGTRFAPGGGSDDITWVRRTGNWLLGRLANLLFGSRYTDLCYGYNAFWVHRLPVLGIGPRPDRTTRQWGDGFEIETLINVRAAARGLTVAEVPSYEHNRIHGASNLNALTDGLRVLRTLLVEARVARTKRRGPDWYQPELAPDAAPTVSVVIAAYADERWGDLVDAVESVASQTLPAVETIVVIDHNPLLLARATHELRGASVVANTAGRGASGARNTGVAVASGEIVAFLDDDAVASSTWLERLVRPFHDTRVVGTGGALRPRWQMGRPRWFPPEFDWVVGATYRGSPTRATRVRNVWSVNMALRRAVFDQVGGFRAGFGKVGARSRPEDTDLCLRASEVDAHAWWVYEPAAFVQHKVPTARRRWRYFLSRCYHEGCGKAELAALVGAGRGTSVERRYVSRVLPRGVARCVWDTLRGDIASLARAAAMVLGLAAVAGGMIVTLTDAVVHGLASPEQQPDLDTAVPTANSEGA